MKPYYEQDGVTIYHGDCLHVPIVPCDALLSDPPYGIGFSEYESHKDHEATYGDILDRVFRWEWCVKDGWCGVFQPAPRVREWADRIQRDFRVWACCKDFGQVFKSIGPAWRTDFFLFWKAGDPRTPSDGVQKGRDWSFHSTANTRNRPEHPCSRPIGQMRDIVSALTVEGQIIVDPFMGSGTTLVAAKNLGRRAIGIEIEERYCEIAAKRLSQTVMDFLVEESCDT